MQGASDLFSNHGQCDQVTELLNRRKLSNGKNLTIESEMLSVYYYIRVTNHEATTSCHSFTMGAINYV